MHKGVNPRQLLSEMGVEYDQIPDYVEDVTIWNIIINMLTEPPRRNKLRHVNTLDDVVRLLKGTKWCNIISETLTNIVFFAGAQNIIVLTGAGVSVSCGIPDFRSRDGIYSRLAIDFPNLPDPQAMFDISYFSQDPRPFFKFARDIYPGKFQPSPCHRYVGTIIYWLFFVTMLQISGLCIKPVYQGEDKRVFNERFYIFLDDSHFEIA